MKWIKYLKNKYIITFLVFIVYILFLDNVDIFNIVRQESRLDKIKREVAVTHQKYIKVQKTLNQLNNLDDLAKYAREKKLFKKQNEDLYVIVHKPRKK